MISEEEISQVRSATDLVALIGARVVLRQRRQEFWGCCPFHNEKTPSFKIDPTSQFYYCFGCGESGDAFTYTMKTENVDFPDAVRLLAQRANIELKEDASNPQRGRKARLYAAAEAAADFYHQQLMRVSSPKSDAARAYLAARDMGSEVAKAWRLGFAPGGGQLVAHLRSLGFSESEMLDADLARRSGGGDGAGGAGGARSGRLYDRFYDRVIFPIHDLQGRAIAFGGRVFLPGDESPAKYINSSETLLFKKRDTLYALDIAKAGIVSMGSAIIVEGYTDVIAMHQAGFANVVATLGTALTDQHLKLLARYTERVVLLFDSDEAGQRAAERAVDLIGSALAASITENRRADVHVAMLPGAKDPADFLAEQSSEALQAVLDAAVPLVRYGIDRTLARYKLSQPEQRGRAEAAALQLLLPLKGAALASDYLSYLADCFNFDEHEEADMRRRFERLAPRRQSQSEAGPGGADSGLSTNRQTQAAQRILAIERELLFFYIEHPGLRDQLGPELEAAQWLSEGHAALAAELLAMNAAGERPSSQESLAFMTARLPQQAASLSAARLKEYSGIEPARLAERLLFDLREARLLVEIDRVNGERRRLGADDPRNQELYRQLAPLQQELAELRKRFRGA